MSLCLKDVDDLLRTRSLVYEDEIEDGFQAECLEISFGHLRNIHSILDCFLLLLFSLIGSPHSLPASLPIFRLHLQSLLDESEQPDPDFCDE